MTLPHIYCVGHDRDHLAIFKEALQDVDYRVTLFSTFALAHAHIPLDPPDLVILDVSFWEHYLGAAVVEGWKHDPHTAQLRLLVCSVDAKQLLRLRQSFGTLPAAVLPKPFLLDRRPVCNHPAAARQTDYGVKSLLRTIGTYYRWDGESGRASRLHSAMETGVGQVWSVSGMPVRGCEVEEVTAHRAWPPGRSRHCERQDHAKPATLPNHTLHIHRPAMKCHKLLNQMQA